MTITILIINDVQILMPKIPPKTSPIAHSQGDTAQDVTAQQKDWVVYIIQTVSGRLYTGITNDVQRRWQAHVSGKGGAKFFRSDKPKQLLFQEKATGRSEASKREFEIKQLSRQQKFSLIKSQSPLSENSTGKSDTH